MSSSAPIKGTEKLTEAFKNSQNDPNFGYLQISIDMDTNEFVCVKNGSKEDDVESTWTKIQSLLQPKNHTFIITRDPMKEGLFMLIHFGPDLSPVKQRMLYASSRSSLKHYLGTALFTEDYYINHADELTPKRLIDQRTLHEKIDFRSDQEVEKEQTNKEAAPKSVQAQVMKNLPVEFEESAKNAIINYRDGKNKIVFLILNKDNQAVSSLEQKIDNDSIDAIKEVLTNELEPRYILFLYQDSNSDGDAEKIFAYYCPDKAERKLKFTYSTCKANIIDYCEQQNLSFYNKVEISDAKDFSKEYLDYHIFPIQEEKKEFAKPKAKGGKAKQQRKKIDV